MFASRGCRAWAGSAEPRHRRTPSRSSGSAGGGSPLRPLAPGREKRRPVEQIRRGGQAGPAGGAVEARGPLPGRGRPRPPPRPRPELPVPAVPGAGPGVAQPRPARGLGSRPSRARPVAARARAAPAPLCSRAFPALPASHLAAPALSFRAPVSRTAPCGFPPFLRLCTPQRPRFPVAPFRGRGLLSVHSCPRNAFVLRAAGAWQPLSCVFQTSPCSQGLAVAPVAPRVRLPPSSPPHPRAPAKVIQRLRKCYCWHKDRVRNA